MAKGDRLVIFHVGDILVGLLADENELEPIDFSQLVFSDHDEKDDAVNFDDLDASDETRPIYAIKASGAFDETHLIYIIEKLLDDALIDRSRLMEDQYVWSTIRKNKDIMREMGVIDEPHHEFSDFAKTAFERKKHEAAIVLIATAIEQSINVFYRYALQAKDLFTEDEITEIIKSNLPAKTGWLLALISGYRLKDETRAQIAIVSEVRNQIVHFKAVPSEHLEDDSKGSHNVIRQRLDRIDFEKLLLLPQQLSSELGEILDGLRSGDLANYSLAKSTTTMLVDNIKAGKVTKGIFILKQA
jgi:hypothetical protein